MNHKKQAIDLTDLALGIVVLGIVVSIGANILVSVQESRLTDLTSVSVTNETGVTFVDAGDTLANSWGNTVTSCYNVTDVADPILIPTANYSTSIDGANGYITVQNATNLEYPDVNCSYTYYNTSSRADYTLAGDAAAGLGEYGNWFDIIVIVGVAALILTLIFMAFGGNRSGSGTGISY